MTKVFCVFTSILAFSQVATADISFSELAGNWNVRVRYGSNVNQPETSGKVLYTADRQIGDSNYESLLFIREGEVLNKPKNISVLHLLRNNRGKIFSDGLYGYGSDKDSQEVKLDKVNINGDVIIASGPESRERQEISIVDRNRITIKSFKQICVIPTGMYNCGLWRWSQKTNRVIEFVR